jgi:hypothetical protein
MDFLSSATDLA